MIELYSKGQIQERVKEIANEINNTYGDEQLTVIGILNGSFMFVSDLVRQLKMPIELDFFGAKSYMGRKQNPGISYTKELDIDIKGKNVLVVEDIVDSGNTMFVVCDILEGREPKSLRLCTLLHKPANYVKPYHIDWIGFSVPDKFIIGYGLDYYGMYRNLPNICIL